MVKKPDTIKPSSLKEWARIRFLYPYLKTIPKNEKTLDLACGYGFSFKLNPDFYGIELDDQAFRFCRENQLKVIQGSILEPIGFEDSFFDNVFSHDVLEHFELSEVEQIFRNVSKVIRTGGTFLNIIPNRKGYDYGLKINAGHKHFITPQEISEIAEKTGFVFLRSYTSPLPPPLADWFTHNKTVTLCKKL